MSSHKGVANILAQFARCPGGLSVDLHLDHDARATNAADMLRFEASSAICARFVCICSCMEAMHMSRRRCSRRSSKILPMHAGDACCVLASAMEDGSPHGGFNIINVSSPVGAVLNLYKPHTSLLKRRHLCPPMVGYDRSIHRCRLCGPCVPRLYRRRNGMEDLLTRRQCMHPWMHSDRRRGETLSIFLARRCSSCDASSYTKASCFQEA